MAGDQEVLTQLRLPQDLSAALKRAAELDDRSVNGQATAYIRRGLIADGYYQPAAAPVRPVVAAPGPLPPAPVTFTPGPVQKPPSAPQTRLEPISELQALGVATTINEELRREGHSPLTALTYKAICRLLSTTFPDVRDLAAARAKGASQWLAAGALPGLIRALYPDDLGAVAMAKKAQNAAHMKRKIERGSELRQFISAKGIVGKGAVALRRIMDQHFPGVTIDEAIKRGSQAWLEVGVGEDVARRLFDEPTAVEARRRAYARGTAKKRNRPATPAPASAS